MPKSSNTLLFFIFIITLLLPMKTGASYFNPDYILSDYDLTDYQSISLTEIQNFLENIGGALKNYSTNDIDGKEKPASEIIYRASQEYKINPKILITLLQREKSLITKKPIKL